MFKMSSAKFKNIISIEIDKNAATTEPINAKIAHPMLSLLKPKPNTTPPVFIAKNVFLSTQVFCLL